MEGRRVLVTGAASGIGRAMACRFAEAGAALWLVDMNEAGLDDAAAEVRSLTDKTPDICRVDLAHKEEIAALWQRVSGSVDVLVNNAGLYPFREFLAVDEEFLDKILSVNLESVVWMCQEFIRQRKGKGGAIVNVSSIEAILPFKKDMAPYSVSKAGVLALTRALARDYGREGFRINAILPGAVSTPGTQGLMKQAIRRMDLKLMKTGYDFQSRLALGRWGQPDEVARVALFLASDLASYIHGAAIPVDGGFLSS